MNKYQKALNFLCEHAMEWRDDYDWDENPIGEYVPMNEYELKEYREPLQELVEKATPEKVEKQEHLYDVNDEYISTRGICPNCKKWIAIEPADNYDYCQYCGQALDWGDTDE